MSHFDRLQLLWWKDVSGRVSKLDLVDAVLACDERLLLDTV